MRAIACPRCGVQAPFDAKANPSRPFCSERCKMNDLGAWASEAYRVPVAEVPDPQDESEVKDN